jgi:hypothetical protein
MEGDGRKEKRKTEKKKERKILIPSVPCLVRLLLLSNASSLTKVLFLKTACWQASQSLQQRKQFSFASWPFETDVIKKRINHWERIFLFSSLENALFTPLLFFLFFFLLFT